MTEPEIRKLLRKIKESDSQLAFRDFYYLCYDRFYRIAFYFVKNDALSQEIVIDAFVKLWEKRSTLLAVSSIEDFCFILVKNTALNQLERENRHSCRTLENLPFSGTDEYSPEVSLISEELFAMYVKVLDRLPERCREVFLRIREEKQSYSQVAQEMGISVNTVDAQLQKAQNRLKEALMPIISSGK